MKGSLNMHFKDLASYTTTVQENKTFRSGDNFIEIDEKAKSITFDYDNRDYVHLRFEVGSSLVKTCINGQVIREVMPVQEVPTYLENFNVDLIEIASKVPYLQKILSVS
jgi:hypothetical protein